MHLLRTVLKEYRKFLTGKDFRCSLFCVLSKFYILWRAKITNVLGDVIMVPQWQLQKSAMEKFASEHYGEVVICDPGLVYDGRVAVVWRCRSCVQQLKVLGYFCFQVGFRDYPVDFEYDVLAFVPFSHVTAQIAEAKVCFSEGRLQFLFL